MARGLAMLVVLVAGCGRVRFDLLGAQADAMDATDSLAPIECTTWGPFAAPVPLPGPVQSPLDDYTPTPARSETELYFQSYLVSSADIFVATRASRTEMFSAPTLVMNVSDAGGDKSPGLSEDGLVLVLQTDRGGDPDIYQSTRADVATPFSQPQPLTTLDTTFTEKDPWLSADGLRIVFASNRGGQTEPYEAVRTSTTAAFDPPVLLGLGMPGSRAISPTLSADGLTIYFVSNRTGGPGVLDVYTSTRAALDQPFGTPALVPELSSAMDEIGLRLAHDGATMYLNYDTVEGGGANADLDTATRTCLD